MSTSIEVERGGNGDVGMTQVMVNLAYTAVRSAFLPYDAGVKDINKYLDVSTTDDYDNDDLEVQMILRNSFSPIIQEKEMKFFTRDEPSPIVCRYGMDNYCGNEDNNSQARNGKRYGKPNKKGLFVEEKKAEFIVDDGDAMFMGYDYYFEDESGFLNGKVDDLPFWRGD